MQTENFEGKPEKKCSQQLMSKYDMVHYLDGNELSKFDL